MNLEADLRETLREVARAMADAKGDWWIIGSAAAALHGAGPIVVKDVDVLLGLDDARRVLARLGLPASPGLPDGKFHSALFATWRDNPLDVEFMADLKLCHDGKWLPVSLRTRQAFGIAGEVLHAPDREELMALLASFGRPKDIARLRLLHALPKGRYPGD